MTALRVALVMGSLAGCAEAVTPSDAGSDAAEVVDAVAPVDAVVRPDTWITLLDANEPMGTRPDQPGPYDIELLTATLPDASLVMFVPMLESGPPAPLVVFEHGFQLATSDYAALLQRIASHGFFVLGVDTAGGIVGGPTNVDERDAIVHTIEWALTTSAFRSFIDTRHIAVMGHSRGGQDAVLAAVADPRVTAALLLDPVNGCGPGTSFSDTCPDATSTVEAGALTIPVGVMGETNDTACAPLDQNYTTFYAALHASPWTVQWTLTAGVHMTFTDDGGGVFGRLCAMEPADAATLREAIQTTAVAFMRFHLLGDAEAEPWLTGSSVASSITTLGP